MSSFKAQLEEIRQQTRDKMNARYNTEMSALMEKARSRMDVTAIREFFLTQAARSPVCAEMSYDVIVSLAPLFRDERIAVKVNPDALYGEYEWHANPNPPLEVSVSTYHGLQTIKLHSNCTMELLRSYLLAFDPHVQAFRAVCQEAFPDSVVRVSLENDRRKALPPWALTFEIKYVFTE